MAHCGSCRAEIVWATSIIGKPMPMELDADGGWIIVAGVARRDDGGSSAPLYSSHFAHCPQAAAWRKRK